MRCATTSRTSQRAQALGLVQASSGKAARYCCSRSDSVWMILIHSACVDMIVHSSWLPVVPTGDMFRSASGHKPCREVETAYAVRSGVTTTGLFTVPPLIDTAEGDF